MKEPQDAGIGQPMTSASGKESRRKGLHLQIGEDLLPQNMAIRPDPLSYTKFTHFEFLSVQESESSTAS
jgi:hypothetical protein